MNTDIEQLLPLFRQITAEPVHRWNSLLESLTPEQPLLRTKLAALLRASMEPDSLLDQTSHYSVSGGEAATSFHPRGEVDRIGMCDQPVATKSTTYDMRDVKPDLVIGGRYRLIEKIGEGGMGEVWVARQSEPVKRSVAVKLIKSGMDSKSVLSRFEAERQALAIMDHPNIAKVLDGGLMPGGQPFFVMELVKGVPITEFCDRRKLSPEKRLELFVPVCQAIQHAHQKGIIHRDIKPSNVLVAMFDDVPIPKVIDFGIAKATGGGLSDQSVHTVFGGIVGTPQYMSPEQAMLNNLDIDTRSDVYSLGVLLYELLAGAPPFSQMELEKAGVLEILRVVREEEPPRPSAKLSSSQMIGTLSANRSYEPDRLTKLLRSELDWIVLKALEKERANRYESAQSFAMDILRYLAGEQVLAHPPTLAYRIRKVAHRNRGLLAALTAVLLAMGVGLAGTTWQMLRANREATRAMIEADNARQAKSEAEGALITGLLRPLGSGDLEDGSVARMAIEEIARLESQELKLKILDRALRTPHIADRLPTQMAWILQACVGLDIPSNNKASENTLAIFRNRTLEHPVRYAALSCLNELDTIGVLGISDFAEYMKEASEERKAGVWASLVWVNLRDNRKGLISFLIDCSKGSHGQVFVGFATKELEKLASEDAALARELFEQIEEPAQKLKLIPFVNAESPSQRLLAYCSVIDDAQQRGISLNELGIASIPDFWVCLSESEDATFQDGISKIVKLMSDGSLVLSEETMYTNSALLYKVADRLSSQQAAQLFLKLSKDVSTLYGFGPGKGDAVIGVALYVLGRRLSTEDASQQLQYLSGRMAADPRYGTIANSLQGIAGLALIPAASEPNLVSTTLLDYVSKSDLTYVRNACWTTLGALASQIDPAIRSQAAPLIQADLNAQLQFGEFARPEALLDVLVQFQEAGTELNLDSLLSLVLNDYVKSPGIAEQEVAFALKALELLSPSSRIHLAQRYLEDLRESTWETYNWNGTEFETTLLRELAMEDQELLVEAVIQSWSNIPERTWNSQGIEAGTTLATMMSAWPEDKRRSVHSKLVELLRGQSRSKSEATATQPPPQAGMVKCLIVSFDMLMDEHQEALLSLFATDGYWDLEISDEERSKVLNAMSADMLRECWRNFLAAQSGLHDELFMIYGVNRRVKQLAAIGAVRVQKDRDRFVADFVKLFEELTGEDFCDLMNVMPTFKLQLNRDEYALMAHSANRLLRDGFVQAEVIAIADDRELLLSILQRVNCVTELRASVLSRLEQLAFPDNSALRKSNAAFWDSETHSIGSSQPRKHFRSLRDFMLWNQSRQAEERWLPIETIKS